jgi:hypothetical protein
MCKCVIKKEGIGNAECAVENSTVWEKDAVNKREVEGSRVSYR